MCARRFDTQDSLYDTAWSEAHENQIVVACGDGSVKLFDIALNNFPVQSWQEHNREVYSVSWNLVSKDTFASSSWDGTIKIVPSSLPLHVLPPANMNLHTVVTTTPNLDPHSPYPLLHIQHRLFPSLALCPLLCLVRLAPTDLRPSHTRLCVQPPRPPHPYPRRPACPRLASPAVLPPFRMSHA